LKAVSLSVLTGAHFACWQYDFASIRDWAAKKIWRHFRFPVWDGLDYKAAADTPKTYADELKTCSNTRKTFVSMIRTSVKKAGTCCVVLERPEIRASFLPLLTLASI
jgi:hypothetical protein